MDNPIEVEFKFPVDDLETFRVRLSEAGATRQHTEKQQDEYLNDPLRDFRKLDIALRIRSVDDSYCLTFKGPNLDPSAKIRTEIETEIVSAQAARELRATFLGIGFISVATVTKERDVFTLVWQHQIVEVCLDQVEQVGSFVELEIVVERREEVDSAKACLTSLAEHLDLSESTRTSYLAMLLAQSAE